MAGTTTTTRARRASSTLVAVAVLTSVVGLGGATSAAGTVTRDGSFTDIPADHLFFEDITWLASTGAAEGYGDGTYGPTRSVTRQTLVAWLWRLAGEPTPDDGPPFPDVAADHLFADPIAWAAEQDLIEGFPDGTFGPTEVIRRQHVVTLMWRLSGEPDAGAPPPFFDTPPDHPFADAIAWAYLVDLTEPYPDGTFRPIARVTRQTGAAFLHRADGLGLLP